MADEGDMAAHYQMLEELGSKSFKYLYPTNWDRMIILMARFNALGGSFGTVYKAIEKATGEVVAVKHVCHECVEANISRKCEC